MRPDEAIPPGYEILVSDEDLSARGEWLGGQNQLSMKEQAELDRLRREKDRRRSAQ